MVSLSDPDFKVRARAAMLLGNRREKRVPDGLLQVARTDRHLLATYYAIVPFGYITRRMNRPIAAGQEPIGISQLIEMFDIDKLDQWWTEHSAEINERLADMK
jgi:HEAT repeat protein